MSMKEDIGMQYKLIHYRNNLHIFETKVNDICYIMEYSQYRRQNHTSKLNIHVKFLNV